MASIPLPHPLGTQQIPLARRQRQQRVVPERVVVVEILVTLDLSQHALGDELAHRVLDPLRPAIVPEAARKAPQQAGPLRHLPEQQQTRIARLATAIERGLDPTTPEALKLQLTRTTVCRHRADPPVHDLS